MLNDLPEMYRHCKAIEDKDMTPLDFITDHLINIDGIFDKHENGDEQKPHTPIQNHHHGQTTVSFITYLAFTIIPFHSTETKQLIPSDNFLVSEYIKTIFKPPIVA